MPTLSPAQIADLIRPYLGDSVVHIPGTLYQQLSGYLDLLLAWNVRTNLTAVREPERIVQRHFGESLFAGAQLSRILPARATLLDFGSGAGFPGLPIQLLLPSLQVTLAESQGKKAAFLLEATRVLGVSCQIWNRRVEAMPANRRFDCVTLRAVDQMESARHEAKCRIAPGGWLAVLEGRKDQAHEVNAFPVPGGGMLKLQQQLRDS